MLHGVCAAGMGSILFSRFVYGTFTHDILGPVVIGVVE